MPTSTPSSPTASDASPQGAAPSYTDYVIAAAARALVRPPDRQLTDHRRRGGLAADRARRHGGRPRQRADRPRHPRHRRTRPGRARVVESTRLAEAARAGALAARRPRGWHLLGEHPRHVRRRRVHAGHQPTEHGDPRRRPTARRRRARCRRPGRHHEAPHAQPHLGPPGVRRRPGCVVLPIDRRTPERSDSARRHDRPAREDDR